MMSMKSDAKPVSFVEDCAVPLSKLADYTQGLNDIFEKYETSGTWYAHASWMPARETHSKYEKQ